MSDSVYGIDLGTTYSAIARINDLGQAEVVNNYDSNPTTPSVVYFEDGNNIVVGEEAKRVQRSAPDHACSLIKRHMGTAYPQDFHGERYTPESISALILKELVNTANNEGQQQISKVVITVPAYFGVKEKEATRQAGEIAGLEVVGIVTEPVAAALSLGIRGENAETVLVYDLGGGTFDTTVMRAEAGKVEVVAVDGNKTLGGADWDTALTGLVVEKFIEAAGLGDDNPLHDEDFEAELTGQVEETKKSLTKREKATVRCRYKDHDEKIEVTRNEFDAATRHLVAQTLEIAQRTVATAEEKKPGLTVDRVLLVGGSAKMPMIEAALREELGWDPARSDFDLAVAKGAAIYGQAAVDEVLSTDGTEVAVAADAEQKYFLGGAKALSVTNVLSRGLGVRFQDVEKDEEYISFLVHANDSIPTQLDPLTALTLQDNQTAVSIALYEQGGELESPSPQDNQLLQEKSLDIPPMPKESPVEITLAVTAEGLARVTAYEPTGKRTIDVEAQVSVLSRNEVEQAAKQVSGLALRS
ncbi:molecular chaperone DnaK [Nocardiopsis terrae]|uniref:Molecular chaperone DnaK (HSP70) n=1 Tax=Nocardiopsis terrae TaxID=372655 RepID=A0ABR9HC38_9ACTN|nr:Hsp70 family protein [Nocardiopsis terrae]MBE1456586.1 molecular chaperone DnaK (HSP70) [Nocardiopsis terrae]GHC76070.1 molecular chaperone DnaK [Nocardiopsis terrae]